MFECSREECQKELPGHAATEADASAAGLTSTFSALPSWSVVLPWPSGTLSPNSRHHWRYVAKAKKEYRAACGVLAMADGARLAAPVMAQAVEAGRKIRLHCEFFPPDKRRHDDANLMHRMKSGIDGIADALGIDDRNFKTSYDLHEKVGGFVRLTMTVHV
jgi:crossover junction endodeoxyribonuclease RusA